MEPEDVVPETYSLKGIRSILSPDILHTLATCGWKVLSIFIKKLNGSMAEETTWIKLCDFPKLQHPLTCKFFLYETAQIPCLAKHSLLKKDF